MGKQRYEVEGFSFEKEEDAVQAKKELEGVLYIKSKLDMENPEKVLQIYNRTVKENAFKTPVGIYYLHELQQYLKEIPYIKASTILPIPTESLGLQKEEVRNVREGQAEPERKIKQKNIDFRKRYKATFSVAVVLLIMVIAMFVITLTSNTPTILNYENQLINRYEHWEQELNEREKELDEREKKLTSWIEMESPVTNLT